VYHVGVEFGAAWRRAAGAKIRLHFGNRMVLNDPFWGPNDPFWGPNGPTDDPSGATEGPSGATEGPSGATEGPSGPLEGRMVPSGLFQDFRVHYPNMFGAVDFSGHGSRPEINFSAKFI